MEKDTADPAGACMCAEFADGRHKTLHNWGQPGCKHESDH
jgi:hypothetical protein